MSRSVSEQFFWAAFNGPLSTLQSLHETFTPSDLDVNWRYQGRFSPFFAACQKGNLEAVEFLLGLPEGEVDVNLADTDKSTPCFTAAQYNHSDVVARLLQDPRVDCWSPHHDGCTPFFSACQHGHTRIAELLAADVRVDVARPKDGGFTPFHTSCSNDHTDIVRLLCNDPRVDVNRMSSGGGNPLLSACFDGHDSAVTILLDCPRIDVNVGNWSNCSPLYMASQQGHKTLVERILASHHDIDTQRQCNTTTDPEENGMKAAAWARKVQTLPRYHYMTEEDYDRSKLHGNAIGDLIDAYDADKVAVRAKLRTLPHLRHDFINKTFALAVFASDDFLKIGEALSSSSSSSCVNSIVPESSEASKAKKFLRIMSSLPLELQMILCHRMHGSMKNFVICQESEKGFKWLAMRLLLDSAAA